MQPATVTVNDTRVAVEKEYKEMAENKNGWILVKEVSAAGDASASGASSSSVVATQINIDLGCVATWLTT
jgi:hypothetical protein